MIENLKTFGFKKQIGTKNIYVLKINVLMYLEYDLKDGFMTMVRHSEYLKRPNRIIIPKPVRNNKALKKLISVILP
jgi:hypothetical protein